MAQENKKAKQKQVKNEKTNQKDEKRKEESLREDNFNTKYGPPVRPHYQTIYSPFIIISTVLFLFCYNFMSGEIYLPQQSKILLTRTMDVKCSRDYAVEISRYPQCIPQGCKRMVSDKLVSSTETDVLLKMATDGLNLAGSDGGASILDLHSGALSRGQDFIDIYTLPEAKEIFNNANLAIYKVVKTKIQYAVAHIFGIPLNAIFLTKPTFFSRMTNVSAETIHDEYWHPHIDKETYEFFHYTSLLYLNDFGKDFEGGRFMFINENNIKTIIEPRKGRVSSFTSGSENLHEVERVRSGARYALTISFTCNPNAAISDPNYQTKQKK